MAKELLGKILISGNEEAFCGGIIVETEAYYGRSDPASHAYNGITPRSKIMFGNPGTAYVYFCYGNHHLLNLVTEAIDVPGAVLIRAARPVFGIEIMEARRKTTNIYKLAKGPGNLTKAFGVDGTFNGKDITDIQNSLFVLKAGFLNLCVNKDYTFNGKFKKVVFKISDEEKLLKEIVASSRIGIKQGKEELLRFYFKGSKFVSGKHV